MDSQTDHEVIDAHLHLWDLERGGYGWLGPQHGALYRSFGVTEARHELSNAGVSGAILVQADDTAGDTDYLLDVARTNNWIRGVVAWIQLDDPAAAARELEGLAGDPKFCGVRHLVHNDPRENFLELPEVRESLKLVARRGLAFDVPDAWPRHLGQTVELARALPELTVVLDHLGKPPLGAATTGSAGSNSAGSNSVGSNEELEAWRNAFRELAALPNTVAKFSGLHLEGVPYTAEALRPLWDEAMESFGPSRLIYGGDWPVSLLGSSYARTSGVIRELSAALSPAEQGDFFQGTAGAAYRLAPAGSTQD